MNRAELYAKANPMQIKDARFAMEKYKDRLGTNDEEHVLDVGCGPGNVTVSVLKPALSNQTKIVGCDISEVMVAFANAKYANDFLCFKQLDIESLDARNDLEKETFNKIFSFYCLHWINDQRRAAENIYRLLKPGGQILVVFLATNPIFTLYEELSSSPKWGQYMKGVEKFISPYHNCRDPGGDFGVVLKKANFESIQSLAEERRFIFPSEQALLKSIEAVNPFLDAIPPALQSDYNNDITRVIKEKKLAEIQPNGCAEIYYQLIVAVASKPSG